MKLATVRVNGIKQKTYQNAAKAAAYARQLAKYVDENQISCKWEEIQYPSCETNSVYVSRDGNHIDEEKDAVEKYRAFTWTYADYMVYIDLSRMGSEHYITYHTETYLSGKIINCYPLWVATWDRHIKREYSSNELAAYAFAGKMLAAI